MDQSVIDVAFVISAGFVTQGPDADVAVACSGRRTTPTASSAALTGVRDRRQHGTYRAANNRACSDLAAVRCCAYTTHHLQTLNSRALKRGEAGFSVDEAIDILIAPICYRILFSNGETSPEYVNALLARFANPVLRNWNGIEVGALRVNL